MLSVTEGSFRFEYVHHFGRCTTVRQQQHLQTYYDLEAIAIRLEAITTIRLEAIATRMEAIPARFLWLLG